MSNWVFDYAKAINDVSESPLSYNIWSGISVISSTLKRNVFLHYKTFTLYPNQYIVLVGPPGIGKGVAMRDAHRFSARDKLINYLSDRVTAPRIIERLFQGFTAPLKVVKGQVTAGQKDSTVTLTSTELPTLIGSSDWMLTFLCDAWDKGEFDYDTRNKGSFKVEDMCVSLIGGCTPDFIRKIARNSSDTVSTGFSARTLFIHAKEKSKCLPWAEGLRNNPLKKLVIDDLENRIQSISNLAGEFKFDPFAQRVFEDYYLTLTTSEDDSDVYRNFRSRQHIHVMKTAMALAAADSNLQVNGSLYISKATLEKSIILVEEIAKGLDEIFRGVGESDVATGLARVQTYIERKGSVSFNQLVADNVRHVNYETIIKILDICFLIGFCSRSQSGLTQIITCNNIPVVNKGQSVVQKIVNNP
jgi:Protein of unknown function (DUF3987)